MEETVVVAGEKMPSEARLKVKAKPKKRLGSSRRTHGRTKTKKSGSARTEARKTKKRGKVPGHWSKTHAQLVLHATPELVAKLDRKLTRLGKTLKLNKPTRGSVLRALVERACR